MAAAHVGIGSNVGDARVNVESAIEALGALGTVRARSSLYRTQPWGNTDQPAFVNAVVSLETALGPHELLAAFKALERTFGRDQESERWGPRTLDLDILTYDDVELDEPHLTIPHRHLHERAFVLVPLAEIDDRYADSREALSEADLAGVVKL